MIFSEITKTAPPIRIGAASERDQKIRDKAPELDIGAGTHPVLSATPGEQSTDVSSNDVVFDEVVIPKAGERFFPMLTAETRENVPYESSAPAVIGSMQANDAVRPISTMNTSREYRFNHERHESLQLVEFNGREKIPENSLGLASSQIPHLGTVGPRPDGICVGSVKEWRPVMNAILNEIKGRIRIGEHEAVLQLDAPELGKVEIEIRLHGEQLSAQILTESIESQLVVERHLGELRQALSDSGLQLVDVHVDNGAWQGQRGADQHTPHEGFHGRRFTNLAAHSPTVDETRRVKQRLASNGALSMWA
jgi:flagellar hook-length control protein FliK